MHFKLQRKFPLVCTELFIWVWHLKFVFNSANSVLRWWWWSQYVLYGVCTESVTLPWRGSEVELASPCFEHLSLPLQRVLDCFPVTVIITKTESDLGKKGSTWLVLPDQNPSLTEVGAEGPGIRKPGGKSGWRDLGAGSGEECFSLFG